MNHLAHFALSNDDDDLKMGNFIADFISNKDLPLYTEGVKKGILLHRKIDAFTDTHPVVKQSTKRLHPYHHKYAPVIVDIYYDFLLAKNWNLYFDPSVSLRLFIDEIYKLLKIRHLELPIGLRKRIDYMIDEDWLMKYSTYEGLQKAFERIEKAAAFPGNFGNAAAHLEQFLPEFDAEFRQFFPELLEHSLQKISPKTN